MFGRFLLLLAALALLGATSSAQFVGHWEGDTIGDNTDVWINPGLGPPVPGPVCPPPTLLVPGVSVIISGCPPGPPPWTPVLGVAPVHGGAGPVFLKVRTTCVNGPAVPGIPAFNITEVLIAGPLLATIPGSHAGGVAAFSVPVPCAPALIGLSWAAQATVAGGGFVDLSTAINGVIG